MASQWLTGPGLCLAMTALIACGSQSSGPESDQGALEVGTLAYFNTTCTESAGAFDASQAVRILHGESEHTVVELSYPSAPASGLCPLFGALERGNGSVGVLALQRIGVTPDGETVVFEVTDDFTTIYANPLTAEQEGLFAVNADGSGLRRLGRASRYPNSGSGGVGVDPNLVFSQDGRRILLTDLGPGPDDVEAAQIFLLDLETGERTQVTRLPPSFYLCCPAFVGSGRIAFVLGDTAGRRNVYTVRLDGSDLTLVPPTVASPGSSVMPTFQITSSGRTATIGSVATPAVNPIPGYDTREVFVFDGSNFLQVTNFLRADTARYGVLVSHEGERVFYTASGDPLGENPSGVCQVFSSSVLGGEVQQLTRFSQASRSRDGCLAMGSDGCNSGLSFGPGTGQDARTGALIFDSSCDPFGTTPMGSQLYAIRPDGSGLRELTHARGQEPLAGVGVSVEQPGPWAYGPHS